MTVLDEILVTKLDEVTVLREPRTRDLLRSRALAAPPTRPFAEALRRADGSLAVIGELKRRSPSKGDLAPDLDPVAVATAYEAGGAGALSVLTDALWFGGAVADLHAAREATALPVLRKDFVIDEVQIYETRAIGADAVLLICAAIPEDARLADLHGLAVDLGLAVLVETHDAAEIERARSLGAGIVGVNNRDLATFTEDLGLGAALARRIPADVIAVAESAVRSGSDATAMAEAGFDAVLVGEALVRASDPVGLIGEMRAARVERRG
ncbi:MAG: indole-3-glycerol phosphate synthase TrpC [Actinomycetota bacterium]